MVNKLKRLIVVLTLPLLLATLFTILFAGKSFFHYVRNYENSLKYSEIKEIGSSVVEFDDINFQQRLELNDSNDKFFLYPVEIDSEVIYILTREEIDHDAQKFTIKNIDTDSQEVILNSLQLQDQYIWYEESGLSFTTQPPKASRVFWAQQVPTEESFTQELLFFFVVVLFYELFLILVFGGIVVLISKFVSKKFVFAFFDFLFVLVNLFLCGFLTYFLFLGIQSQSVSISGEVLIKPDPQITFSDLSQHEDSVDAKLPVDVFSVLELGNLDILNLSIVDSDGNFVETIETVGQYDVTYYFLNKDSVYKDSVKLNVLQKDVDWNFLKSEIEAILGEDKDKYGVWFYDLDREVEFGVNEDRVFAPASISKVPIAILILRDVDEGKLKLNDELPIKAINKFYDHDKLAQLPDGEMLTIEEYLKYSIVDSDNTASATLEEWLGGYQVVNQRTKDELGVELFFRFPHDSRAKDIGMVYKGIYEGRYLSDDSNDLLLNLLLNTLPSLQDGIPATLPEGTKVAHKTGQLPFYTWNDAAIVYGKNVDYVLVVINYDITYDSARDKVQRISKVVWDGVN